VHDSDEPGELLGQAACQAIHGVVGRLITRRRHHGHQQLAGEHALAHHHMAQESGVLALVVGRDALVHGPGPHGLARGVAGRGGQQARVDVDHLVPAAAAVESQPQLAIRPRRRRVLHLVAVAEVLEGGVGRPHVDALQPADAGQVLRHLLPLGLEHHVVLHVLQAAAAAVGHEGARRRDAPGPRLQHLHQIGLTEPAPGLSDAHPGRISRRGVGSEHHEAVHT